MTRPRQDAVAALLDTLRPPRRSTHVFGSDVMARGGVDPSCPFCRREVGLIRETFEEPDARAGESVWRPARDGETVPDRVTEDVEHWDETIAFRPLNPVTPNHVLVVPRQHVPDHTHGAALAITMIRAAELARSFEHMGWDTNIISSAGRSATQSIFHLHVHVIPRAPGDGLMVPWGTTGDPQAPHDCVSAQAERDVVAEMRRQMRVLHRRLGDSDGGSPDVDAAIDERVARETVDGRIVALEAQVRELGGVVPPRRES